MIQWTLSALVERFKGRLIGCDAPTLTHLCTLEEGQPGGISFFSDPRYRAALYQTKASVILVPRHFQPVVSMMPVLIGVDDPYAAFALLLEEVDSLQRATPVGIEFPSYIGKDVYVGEYIYRGAFSYIGNHVTIGKHVKIYPHVYIGDHVTIGDDTILYSGVKVGSRSVIGKRCMLHPGSVIGSAGFGFALNDKDNYKRIPSIGYVVLADDVEIGAQTTIDAATVGETRIGQGTKIDNLVQIAHNVKIGNHTAIAAQAGIAGSTKIGNYCKLGGQTGVAGHLKLGDCMTALGQAGITRSFPKGHLTLSGTPAFEHKKFLSCYAYFKKMNEPQEKRKAECVKS